MKQLNEESIAKAVWDYKDKLKAKEDLEKVNFNKCYNIADKELRKKYGFWGFYFTNKSTWNNISKRALIIYENKYGKLKYKGDLNNEKSN